MIRALGDRDDASHQSNVGDQKRELSERGGVGLFRWALTCVWLVFIALQAPAALASDFSAIVDKLQHLYDKQQYRKAVDEISALSSELAAEPDIRRIKIRSLVRLGNPKEALVDYDGLRLVLKQDDALLLREISLGFVLAMINDMREQMRGVAYTALKEWQSPEAIPFLENGLSDGSGIIRALAAEGLAKLEEGRRSARFRQAMDDQAALVKEAVLKGLGKSGDASVVALAESVLQDPEARVRVAAAEVLCRFGRAQGCALLDQSAKAPNPDERTAAIRSLVDLRGARLLPVLIEASEHKQPSVRGVAAMGLAHVPKPEALTALTRLLKDPLPPVRVAAAVSLGRFRSADAVSSLKKALEDHDASVRAFVVGSLLEHGEEFDAVASAVSDLSRMREPAVRSALARALGRASDGNRKPVRSVLGSLAADTMPRVRIAALKAMAKLDGGDALSLLKQGLHDEDDAVRATAGGELLRVMASKQ
ncbi:MAG: HEAT repeat domain-containing protein [Nitrospira sp.]|nr:HEAT repeat domain-containing protein [Nitrospira sp.]MCP9456438.1 HEAT repeat domain-containing protein [Nitrospira sp.]